MNRFLVTSLIAYGLIVFNSEVQSAEHLRYVGFDAGQSFSRSLTYVYPKGDCKKHFSAQFISGYTGYRIAKYAAFEFGAFDSRSLNGSRNNKEGQAKHTGLFMGFVFMLPINSRLEFTPGLGVAQVYSYVNEPRLYSAKNDGVIPRLMFGLQYRITDELKLRASAVWHRTSTICSDIITNNHVTHVGLGLNYSFDPR